MSSNGTVPARPRLFYGWIVVAACLLVTIVTYGPGYSFGVFLTSLREAFGATSAVVSGAYSLSMFLYTGFALPAGWAADRYGPKIVTLVGGSLLVSGLLLTSQVNAPWQLYVTYGLIGTGMSQSYSPLLTAVSRWFVKRRGLALGIATAGMGIGPLVAAPVAGYLIAAQSWRFAFLVLAASAALIIPASFLMKRSPAEAGQLPDGGPADASITDVRKESEVDPVGGLSLREAVATRAFWMLAVVYLMIGIGLQMVLAHVVAYGEGKGISAMTGAAVLSTLHGASIAGRIVMGTASDRIGTSRALAYCLATEGVILFWLAGISSSWMFFVFGAVFGFCFGGHVPQLPKLTGETLGLGHMGAILGAIIFLWGVGAALGPVLAAGIRDVTGSYTSAFVVGAVAMLLAAVLSLSIKKPVR